MGDALAVTVVACAARSCVCASDADGRERLESLISARQTFDKRKPLGEDCAMMKEVAPRNHQYDQAQLTSVVVAETTSQLIREMFVANRALRKIRHESMSPNAYGAAEAACRDATSRFYGF